MNRPPRLSESSRGRGSNEGHLKPAGSLTQPNRATRQRISPPPPPTQYYSYRSSRVKSPAVTASVGSYERPPTVERSSDKIILNEYTIEREVVVPKKLIREDVWEKTLVIPESVVVEEIVEDTQTVIEKIVEVATPIIREKVVEVPIYDFVERTVEVPQKLMREKIIEVPKVELVERIRQVPRFVDQEKVVEVPVVEYRDVPVEKIIEIPEVREKTVFKEVPVPRYVERPVRQDKTVEIEEERVRLLPVPVESKTSIEFTLPKIRPVYTSVPVPVYVPRFVEVPISYEFCDEHLIETATRCNRIVSNTLESAQEQALPLTVLEKTADMVREHEFETLVSNQRVLENFAHWWRTNRISIDEVSVQSICKSTEDDGMVVLEAVSLISHCDRKITQTTQDDGIGTGIEAFHGDVEVPECVATADGDSSMGDDDECHMHESSMRGKHTSTECAGDEDVDAADIDEEETFEEELPAEDQMSAPELDFPAGGEALFDAAGGFKQRKYSLPDTERTFPADDDRDDDDLGKI